MWDLLSYVFAYQIEMYVCACSVHTTMLYQETTNMCLGPLFSSWISHATLNHTRNVSNSRAVVRYAECPRTSCSSKVVCKYAQIRAYWKGTAMRVWRNNLSIVSCIQNQKQKIDTSNCRAVIWFEERPYATSGFWVMIVSRHKMLFWEEVVLHISSHNLPIVSLIQF